MSKRAWQLRMRRKLEASSEALYDKIEAFVGKAYEQTLPYLLVFAGLLIVWETLKVLRAAGMTGHFFDCVETADKIAAMFNLVALLLDEMWTLVVSIYDKHMGQENEE